jgi:hypothetical protein
MRRLSKSASPEAADCLEWVKRVAANLAEHQARSSVNAGGECGREHDNRIAMMAGIMGFALANLQKNCS